MLFSFVLSLIVYLFSVFVFALIFVLENGVKHKPTNQPLSLDMTISNRTHFPDLYDNSKKGLKIP